MFGRLFVVLIALASFPSPMVYASTTICHRVNGRGNTGNGYNLMTVTDAQLERHRQHPGDLIPAPNGFCLVLFPPTTTAPPTTRPPVVTTPPTAPPQPPTTRPTTQPPPNPPTATTRPHTNPPTVVPTTAPGASPPPPAGTLPDGTLPASR